MYIQGQTNFFHMGTLFCARFVIHLINTEQKCDFSPATYLCAEDWEIGSFFKKII